MYIFHIVTDCNFSLQPVRLCLHLSSYTVIHFVFIASSINIGCISVYDFTECFKNN